METKHRPSTDDDGGKHCFALPKITTKRCPRAYIERASVWVSEIYFQLIIGTINYFIQYFVPLENGGSSWNDWELTIGERGSTRRERRKENMLLVDRVTVVVEVHGVVCQLYFKTFGLDSGDIKALRSQSIIYRYVLNVHCIQWCRKHWYILREGRVN